MKRRPGSVTTFAILNLVFGGLFLICGLVGMAEGKVEINGKDVTQDLKDYLASEVPGYVACRVGSLIVGLIVGIGFIASGIGLLQVQGWGRILALVSAILALVLQIFQVIYQLAFVNPAVKSFFANTLLGFVSGMSSILTVAGALFLSAYCIVVLIVMLQSGTARVFRADCKGEDDYGNDRPRRRARDEEEDYDDYPPRRSGRRARDDDYDDDPPRRSGRRRDDDDNY